MAIAENLPHFILASASPRRKMLLEEAGLEFEIFKVDADETVKPNLGPLAIVDDLALRKMAACDKILDKHLVITADTLVFKNNQVLGKPVDRSEAVEMLNILSGTNHSVTTSVCLGYQGYLQQFNVTTTVYFNQLTAAMIDYYIDNYKPFDKAGSYGIQEWIGHVGVKRIDGSYSNVVGLPVAETYSAIQEVSKKWNLLQN